MAAIQSSEAKIIPATATTQPVEGEALTLETNLETSHLLELVR